MAQGLVRSCGRHHPGDRRDPVEPVCVPEAGDGGWPERRSHGSATLCRHIREDLGSRDPGRGDEPDHLVGPGRIAHEIAQVVNRPDTTAGDVGVHRLKRREVGVQVGDQCVPQRLTHFGRLDCSGPTDVLHAILERKSRQFLDGQGWKQVDTAADRKDRIVKCPTLFLL